MLTLQKLNIHQSYRWKKDEPLKYEGEIKYSGDHGDVSIHLNHETSLKVLAVVADQLVESSKELAQDLTREIVESQPLLTHGEDES